ncbi:hypothetical protein DYB26_007780, partial [Aphanomyces astaci]
VLDVVRSEELKALYEKIKIQKSTLSIGQVQYLERVKDVQHLQKRVQDLMDEHKKTQNQIACTGWLRISWVDLLIVEKEKLYVELKNVLARQPGPEVAEQLLVYQDNLKKKQSQMKGMENELEMYKAQVREYKHDLQHIDRDMQALRDKWFNSLQVDHFPEQPQDDTQFPPTQA